MQDVSPLRPSPPTIFPLLLYRGRPPPKTMTPPIALPTIGSFGVPKAGGVAEYGLGIGGGAGCQAVEALPRLRRGEVVCRRKREVIAAQAICGAGFGGRDHATAWPLIAPRGSAENDGADDPVAIYNRGPLLVAHPAVLGGSLPDHGLKRASKARRIRKLGAIGFRLREARQGVRGHHHENLQARARTRSESWQT